MPVLLLTQHPVEPQWVGFFGQAPFGRKPCREGPTKNNQTSVENNNNNHLQAISYVFLQQLCISQFPNSTFWSRSWKCSVMTAKDLPLMAKWYCSWALGLSVWHTSSKQISTFWEKRFKNRNWVITRPKRNTFTDSFHIFSGYSDWKSAEICRIPLAFLFLCRSDRRCSTTVWRQIWSIECWQTLQKSIDPSS